MQTVWVNRFDSRLGDGLFVYKCEECEWWVCGEGVCGWGKQWVIGWNRVGGNWCEGFR